MKPSKRRRESGRRSRRGRVEWRSMSFYEIEVEGRIEPHWSEWLDGLSVAHNDAGNTLLRGPVRDQAALFGLLARVRDLALPLVALRRIAPDQIDPD